ncbi:hypothetical protein [Clostridium tyrobutyricum]|uniref:hypothetical protein n=1 Tax=Clostridium tyrobutyricum TaxID=1519 RepID=UPI00073D6F28|nr:hypothetical protein [Clostridium tyrobutyricum]
MDIDELRKRRKEISSRSDKTLKNMDTISYESFRVAEVAHNSKEIINNLDFEFKRQTGLNGLDVKFLFFATALQCIRQYLITQFNERVDDKIGAKNVKGNYEEHSNRAHRWYKPSLDEIITNPVPFDTNFGSRDFDLGIGGGFTHRSKTLGHDPVLGWIFGTMNIVTSTMTTWDFQSYHIKTGQTVRGDARDKIINKAETSKVIYYTKERFFSGNEGRAAVATALIKEAIHLKSDVNTFAGLPLPIISSISPEFSRHLADYGLDMGNALNVGKQASYAALINSIVAMIHGLFYDKSKYDSWSVYGVKTRKILSYSNVIASASNIIYVAVSVYLGNESALKKLDIGGLIVTIYRLLSDSKFIREVKEEFVFGGFNKLIQGEEYNF